MDFTGGMKYLYTLPSYDAGGKEKEITFGTYRVLKDKAYLKPEYTATRGVLDRCEVKWEELPASVQGILRQP